MLARRVPRPSRRRPVRRRHGRHDRRRDGRAWRACPARSRRSGAPCAAGRKDEQRGVFQPFILVIQMVALIALGGAGASTARRWIAFLSCLPAIVARHMAGAQALPRGSTTNNSAASCCYFFSCRGWRWLCNKLRRIPWGSKSNVRGGEMTEYAVIAGLAAPRRSPLRSRRRQARRRRGGPHRQAIRHQLPAASRCWKNAAAHREARARPRVSATSRWSWVQLRAGAPMNDALLSGNLDFASGGVGPLLTIWDRTKGNVDVKGIGCFNSTALYLNTHQSAREDPQGFHGQGPHRPAGGEGLDPGRDAADGGGEGIRRRPARQTRPPDRVDVASGRARRRCSRASRRLRRTSASPPFQYQQLEDPTVQRCSAPTTCWVARRPSTRSGRRRSSATRTRKTYKAFVDALDEAHDVHQEDTAGRRPRSISTRRSRSCPQAFVGKMLDRPGDPASRSCRRTP